MEARQQPVNASAPKSILKDSGTIKEGKLVLPAPSKLASVGMRDDDLTSLDSLRQGRQSGVLPNQKSDVLVGHLRAAPHPLRRHRRRLKWATSFRGRP